jgi:tripartite-type tricarboxylate transporter receptor subunit TctC
MKKWFLVSLILVLAFTMVSATGDGEDGTDGVEMSSIDKYLASGDVEIYCPGKTGGTADIVTRAIARYLEDEIGKTVIVINKPGAGGLLCLTEYMLNKPNTTTLTVSFNSTFTLEPFFNDVPIAMEDLQPIIGMDAQPRILYVNANKTGVNSFDELIQYGKSNFIPYGSGANTNQFAIGQKALFDSYGIESALIIDKKAMASLLGGHIVTTIASPQAGYTFLKEGSIKPIAVFSDEPYTGFEGIEVPTAKSLGFDAFIKGYRFIAITKGTDQEIVDFWFNMFTKIFSNPAFIEEMKAFDVTMTSDNPSEVKATIERMYNSHKSLLGMIKE